MGPGILPETTVGKHNPPCHMLPSRRCEFQQDNAKPYTAAIKTAWLRSRQPQSLQQLETYSRQEWEQFPEP